ncbi:MAG: hypothetical protein ACJ79L_08945 [Anaeromyxobacteraceae bacterium]
MPEYRPPQRVIRARILTPSGWIRGSFHVPRMQSFHDFLGQRGPFFNLTEVAIAARGAELPYLALRRSAVRVIVPSIDERRLLVSAAQPGAVERTVTCVLDAYAVSGRVAVPAHLRVSDYLAHHSGFIQLRDADLGQGHERTSVVFLNVAALVAVSEGPRPAAVAEIPSAVAVRAPTLAATA